MYLGEKRLGVLQSFIFGYYFAQFSDSRYDLLDNFDDWIANYYGWNESTAGWKNIIIKECNGDKEKAVDEFFKLFDKFNLKT